MSQNRNNNVTRVQRSENKNQPQKKTVRKVVRVISKEELKNTNINKELAEERKKIKQKDSQEATIQALKEKVEKQKQQTKKLQRELKKVKADSDRYVSPQKTVKINIPEKKDNKNIKNKNIVDEKKRLEKEALNKQKELKKKQQKEAIEKKKKEFSIKIANCKNNAITFFKTKKEEILKERENRKLAKIQRKNEKTENKKLRKQNKKPLSTKYKILKVLKVSFISLFITGLAGVSVLFLILYSWCQDMPEINVNELKQTALSSYVYDINEDLITTYSGSENREWVRLEDMPQTLIDAFVNIEDKRFYEHHGVDAKRFLSAVAGQLTGSGDHGGSTITQQLIKNVYLTNEVTYKRKMQEILLAFNLEKQMTKDEILEAYLNVIYFGSSNYGVSAAAQDYFGKDLDELNLREIAMLAGIPKNPNGYNPRRNTYIKKDMSKTNERTDNVLWVMRNEGVITEEQYQMALNQDVEIKENSSFFKMYDYAHAVEYAMSDVIDDMLELRDLDNTYSNRISIENEIRKGGYKIYTTIDPDIQNSVQETVENWDKYPYILTSNGEKAKVDDEYVKPEVASVVIDPNTGHILAMVGSRNTVTSMKTFNRAVSNNMPIASSIKPLSIYAPCVEKGLYPGSIEYNYKTYIEGYDRNSSYPGGTSPEAPVTMREAIAQSYNVAAARFLCNNIGYEESEDYLIKLGINKESIQKNGAGLALGTSGINILELTAAYQSFANGGWYYEPKAYTKVIDNDGNIILDSTDYQVKRQIFSEETAWLMTDMLTNCIENGSAYKALLKETQAAGKTGTHEDKCAVFAGYTGEYVSAIWVGSDSFSSMSDASGGRQAAPIWQAYMSSIYSKKGVEKELIYDDIPKGIKKVELCSLSGKLATDKCPETFTDYVGEESILEDCDLHVTIKICNYSGMLVGDDCPESAIREENKLFIPLTSNLASIPSEIILKHYPNAMIESPESICVSHINGTAVPSTTQIGYMKSLLSKLDTLRTNTLFEQQYIDLANTDYNSASAYIARAENALYNNAKETDSFYSEYFNEYNQIKNDINNLQAILNNIVTPEN